MRVKDGAIYDILRTRCNGLGVCMHDGARHKTEMIWD